MKPTPPARGRLKVFLGYAAGVGKTYQMLVQARKLKAGGKDVVIGYFEPHGRADTIALSEGLESIPRKTVEYRGARFEEMDTEALVQRCPQLALVDELPHTNVPGSRRSKRWEDVHELLDAGIDVLTTMNVQHLESLNDQIWQSAGVRVRETIPDWVPTAALENFFKESTLVALRELAMRQAAYVVESRLPGEEAPSAGGAAVGVPERLLLVPVPGTAHAHREAIRAQMIRHPPPAPNERGTRGFRAQ